MIKHCKFSSITTHNLMTLLKIAKTKKLSVFMYVIAISHNDSFNYLKQNKQNLMEIFGPKKGYWKLVIYPNNVLHALLPIFSPSTQGKPYNGVLSDTLYEAVRHRGPKNNITNMTSLIRTYCNITIFRC